jgi:predicted signal transduction protein with EAL and GGDEF domain
LSLGQLRLVFQPIVALADRSLVGHEALLRWDSTGGEMSAPADFRLYWSDRYRKNCRASRVTTCSTMSAGIFRLASIRRRRISADMTL